PNDAEIRSITVAPRSRVATSVYKAGVSGDQVLVCASFNVNSWREVVPVPLATDNVRADGSSPSTARRRTRSPGSPRPTTSTVHATLAPSPSGTARIARSEMDTNALLSTRTGWRMPPYWTHSICLAAGGHSIRG